MSQRSAPLQATSNLPAPLDSSCPEPAVHAEIKPWFFKPRKSRYGLEDAPKKRKFKALHWQADENQRYADFLTRYMDLVKGDVLQKRKYHLNRMMSKHIATRSPVQCRSHHQKMLQAFGSLEAIVNQLLPPSQLGSTHSQLVQAEQAASPSPQPQASRQEEAGGEIKARYSFLECDLMETVNMDLSLWDVLSYPQVDSDCLSDM